MSRIDDLVSQAHAAWDLFELERAAKLFEAAAVAEKEAAAQRAPFARPDQSFLYRLRAALCLWDLGCHEQARNILLEAVAFDWKTARLWGDRRDTERAFARLLMEKAAAGDRDGFIDLWQLASRRGAELNVPFPLVIPHEKQLLRACVSLEFEDGCLQIMERIDPKRLKADHELQMLKAQAERFCGPE
jgi:tetratricopeptide (TPR) repeat protein